MVDGKDDFKNDFHFFGMKFANKSILGPKWELTQNVGTKSAFSPKKKRKKKEKEKKKKRQGSYFIETMNEVYIKSYLQTNS